MCSRLKVLAAVGLALVLAGCARDPDVLKREFVESGDRYVAEQKYGEAIVEYRNAINLDNAFGEARFKLAGAYAESGDLRNALREYIRAADLMPDDIEAQMRAGIGLLAAGMYPEARTRAVGVLEKDPKNVRGLILLGNAMAGMKDLDGAISQVEGAIDSDPTRTLTYANLGALQMARGDRAAAEQTFKRAVEISPESPSVRMALANYYWASGRLAEAEQEFDVALKLEPDSITANRALAVFHAAGGQWAEAERFLKKYAELASQVEPTVLLADFYLVRNRADEAMAVLEPLVKTDAGFVPATLRIAAVAFVSGSHEDGYARIESVLAREPRNEAALIQKGRFLMTDGKYSEALDLADTVIEGNPGSASGHYLRGRALQVTGATDAAVAAFQEVLRLSPSATMAQVKLGELNLARGDAAGAIGFLEQALQHAPRLFIAHFLLAKAQIEQGNAARAEREVNALLRAYPESADVQTLFAEYSLARGDRSRARASYARALEVDEKALDALAGLIRMDLAEKRNDAARSRIEAQLARRPDEEGLVFLAGDTLLATGDSQRAEQMFQRVLQLNPSHIEAYSRLGSLYVRQNRLEEAKQRFEELAERQDRPVAAATMLGVILDVQNRPDEARVQYERALALDPMAAVAANNLAWQYAKANTNLDLALQLAQAAKSRLPDRAQVSDTLGWVYYQKDLASLAVTSLSEAAVQAPSNPSIHYRLGLAYIKNGDERRARTALAQALKLNPAFPEAEEAKRLLSSIRG